MTYRLSSAVYRTIELAGGWNGRVISNELYFGSSNFFSSADITGNCFTEQMFLTALWSHSQYIPSTLLTPVSFCLRALKLAACVNRRPHKKHYVDSLLYSEEFSHKLAISAMVLVIIYHLCVT